MGLPVRDQLKYWGTATAVFLVVLWYLGDVLLPFILGGAIAYFLDPVADRLERAGLSRAAATAVIAILGVLAFVLLALLVIPALVGQAVALIETAPALFRQLQTFLTERFPSLMDDQSTLRQSLQAVGEMIRERGGELLNTVLSSALSIVNIVLLLVVVPVVAVYLLLDWDRMIARIDDLLPRDHVGVIRQLASEIDRTLASFVRGMSTVCLTLGTYYAVSLWLVGLQFGLVVGFVAGLLTFIPYVGALLGGALAMGLALFQFWGAIPVVEGGAVIGHATDWVRIAAVVAIFVIGQVIEGNVLTPRWVGQSVGLHPVWLIFALSVFGTLFGFVGMLVAVPLSAAIGVLARFVMGQYTGGRLYRGVTLRDDDDGPAPDAD